MAPEITDEMFDAKLSEIIDRNPASRLLSITGVYEALREEFNNEILRELEFDYDNPEDIDGADDQGEDDEGSRDITIDDATAIHHWNHFVKNHAPMVIKPRPKDWSQGDGIIIVPAVNQQFVIAAMLTVEDAKVFCERMNLPISLIVEA